MPAAVPSMVFSGRKQSYIHVRKLTEKGHISRSTEKERGLKKTKKNYLLPVLLHLRTPYLQPTIDAWISKKLALNKIQPSMSTKENEMQMLHRRNQLKICIFSSQIHHIYDEIKNDLINKHLSFNNKLYTPPQKKRTRKRNDHSSSTSTQKTDYFDLTRSVTFLSSKISKYQIFELQSSLKEQIKT